MNLISITGPDAQAFAETKIKVEIVQAVTANDLIAIKVKADGSFEQGVGSADSTGRFFGVCPDGASAGTTVLVTVSGIVDVNIWGKNTAGTATAITEFMALSFAAGASGPLLAAAIGDNVMATAVKGVAIDSFSTGDPSYLKKVVLDGINFLGTKHA